MNIPYYVGNMGLEYFSSPKHEVPEDKDVERTKELHEKLFGDDMVDEL